MIVVKQVVRFEADDGSVWKTEAEAEQHSRYIVQKTRENKVAEIVESFVNRRYFTIVTWDKRAQFTTEIAQMIIEAWADLTAVIEPPSNAG